VELSKLEVSSAAFN